MARATTNILDTGDALPGLSFQTVAHGELDLPSYFADRWGVLLVYRAHW
jgi:hypothetical protein